MPPSPRAAALRSVRRRILGWYASEHRDLPFRRSRDPWPVLVAEVMLQQTQAGRVAERFDAFMDRYPSPAAMAAVPPSRVLADWSGLGYNRRALLLQRTSRSLAEQGWPTTVAGLERLPGIGSYSARAIAAIAFGQPVGAVDTNVRRWLVRRFAADAADRAALQRLADQLAGAVTDDELPAPGHAATWTHATMEFGARICTARSPRCDVCPVARGCPSRAEPQRVPVPRQSPATAGARAARGALLRALAAAPRHRLRDADARSVVDEASAMSDYATLTEALARDGLLHRSGPFVVLGPR